MNLSPIEKALVELMQSGMATGIGMLSEPDFAVKVTGTRSLHEIVGSVLPAEILSGRPDLTDPVIAPFLVEIEIREGRIREIIELLSSSAAAEDPSGAVHDARQILESDYDAAEVVLCNWCPYPATGKAHGHDDDLWPKPSCGRARHGFDYIADEPQTEE